jgi:hypothetical protein
MGNVNESVTSEWHHTYSTLGAFTNGSSGESGHGNVERQTVEQPDLVITCVFCVLAWRQS